MKIERCREEGFYKNRSRGNQCGEICMGEVCWYGRKGKTEIGKENEDRKDIEKGRFYKNRQGKQ